MNADEREREREVERETERIKETRASGREREWGGWSG